MSSTDPLPNTFIIDKTIAIAEFKNIEPVLIITKTDLADFSELIDTYKTTGIKIIVTNIANNVAYTTTSVAIGTKSIYCTDGL